MTWVPIEITNCKYAINKKGDIRSGYTGKLRKLTIDKDGYLVLRYRKKDRGTHTLFIHRAIAQAFIPNPDNKVEINHKNGNKKDNRISNLEWCTKTENIRHAFSNNLVKLGENRKHSKLTTIQVRRIRKKYTPRAYSTYRLAKEHNVTQSVIWRLLQGMTYKSVGEKT